MLLPAKLRHQLHPSKSTRSVSGSLLRRKARVTRDNDCASPAPTAHSPGPMFVCTQTRGAPDSRIDVLSAPSFSHFRDLSHATPPQGIAHGHPRCRSGLCTSVRGGSRRVLVVAVACNQFVARLVRMTISEVLAMFLTPLHFGH